MAEKMVSVKSRPNDKQKDDESLDYLLEDNEVVGKTDKDESLSKLQSTKSSVKTRTSRIKSSQGSNSPLNKDKPSTSRDTSQNDQIMNMLTQIKNTQVEQNSRIDTLTNKINDIENDFYNEGEEYDEQEYDEDDVESSHGNESNKRKADDVDEGSANGQSRFSSMSKRFKIKEVCSKKIDETLAENITDLFRNGMDDEQYLDLVKHESTARPENCEGLSLVKTNHLVWNLMSPSTQINDKKLQNCEKSLIKAAIVLAKVVDSMAKKESQSKDKDVGEFIDSCNDVLALLGHGNRQINMVRRDLIKPDLSLDYVHLCAHALPFTNFLFGDDVSKEAKEIETCNKLGGRIRSGRGRTYRGTYRGRYSRGGRGRPRGRGGYSHYNTSMVSRSDKDDKNGPKNLPRRGGARNN